MKLLYFAWVRERVGRAEEEAEAPAGVSTVAELVRAGAICQSTSDTEVILHLVAQSRRPRLIDR
ncbi:hypothetical protein ACIKT0_05945, partial [Hansschlegelia beijingensis]